MSLKEKINDDLKIAMKSGDKIKLNAIRSIRASILELEKSGGFKGKITPDDELRILSSAVKKRKEAIEQFQKAGRKELLERETRELKIIQEYLPEQLTEEEIESEIQKLARQINASSKADFSRLMPLAIKTLKGRADGRIIREIVEKILK